MARIDKFIETIHQKNAECLILASGQQVMLATGKNVVPLTAQAATLQQIQELLREIFPNGAAASPTAEGKREFLYNSPSGPVKVEIHQNNGNLRIQVAPAPGESGSAPAPEPAVTPAPAATTSPVVSPGANGAPAANPDVAPMEALFRKMVEENCSDLHLTSQNPPLFRKDGEIMPIGDTGVLAPDQVERLLRPITPDRNWLEFQERHDTDFSYEIPEVARYRCNLFMDRLGLGGVFRLIPSKIPTAEQLGLSKAILNLCHLSKGLVVVTGPTGSGKSTTLAAMIDYINRNRAEHIITIEDPIEFVHPKLNCLINQREVRVHTKGFKAALRAALREDPDIVLVGEMRDLETVAIAIETAETGHLVFGTLHTNTAPSTVDRIIDQFPADQQSQIRIMLSESLKAVIAQTLLKKKGGGRVAAHEVLLVTSAVSNLIREAKTFQIPSIMQTGRGIGMVTMNDALLTLVKKKLVEPQEALNKATSKTEFKAQLERNGIKIPAKPKPSPPADSPTPANPEEPAQSTAS